MKRFRIPLLDQSVEVYTGVREWKRYTRIVTADGGALPDCVVRGTSHACWLWIADPTDRNTLLHELSHITDYLMDRVGSRCGEFRAYVTAWLGDTLLKHFQHMC